MDFVEDTSERSMIKYPKDEIFFIVAKRTNETGFTINKRSL